ncbi:MULTISPECIES: HPF/RaiA family ribosome-associated protein [unclassified Ralstonia]|uniref:HPF/RaiA family ribosome-associated protein n=1 Tax=unclassified Ralstonia TaxID=209769 RepID=UPI0039AEF07C
MDTRRVEIQFRHLPPSDAIKEAVRRFSTRLSGLPCGVESCSVRLASERAEPLCGGPYFVHVEVQMQGRELAIDQASDVDVHVALLNALRDMLEMIRAAGSKRGCLA